MNAKPYTFRKLKSIDVAPMCKIISKIGITEFTKCFNSESVLNAFKKNKGKKKDVLTDAVGLQAGLEIGNVILKHISDCENDVFSLLASVSGLEVETIKEFDLPTFTHMLIDFVKKEEFSDFIGVVSGLLK